MPNPTIAKKKKHQQLIKSLDKYKPLDNFNILNLTDWEDGRKYVKINQNDECSTKQCGSNDCTGVCQCIDRKNRCINVINNLTQSTPETVHPLRTTWKSFKKRLI